MNARVGLLSDFQKSDKLNSSTQYNRLIKSSPRKNCDRINNECGQNLIEICRSFNLQILNGRVNGDQWGNFTHSNKNCGESTIDLAIVSDALFPHITDLKVLPLNAYSDHSKIILAIDNVLLPPAKKTHYNWVNRKKGYTWEKIENKLLNAMHTPPILTKIQQCRQFLDAGLIESSGKTIQDIFTLAADIASKEVDSNPKPTKQKMV